MPDMRGRAPASAHQKAIAAATIAKTKPWLSATGPKTAEGKARSAGRHHKWEWSADVSDRDAAVIMDLLNARIRFFREHLRSLGHNPTIRVIGGNTTYYCGQWSVKIKLQGLHWQTEIIAAQCPGWLTPNLPTEWVNVRSEKNRGSGQTTRNRQKVKAG
jgi:hypothetical protein